MIFIGQGGALTKAVYSAVRRGLEVECVCCPPQDFAVSVLKRDDIFLLETTNPNDDLLSVVRRSKDGIVFSINNRAILQDRLLESGADFLNIHNGLIQSYRGVAQVCIFAAVCKGERVYGVTLHRIPPGQEVDSGAIVAQLDFSISNEDGFSDVLSRSLSLTHRVFELNVESILTGKPDAISPRALGRRYLYDHIRELCRVTPSDRLRKARDFGAYAQFFPKFRNLVEAECTELGRS